MVFADLDQNLFPHRTSVKLLSFPNHKGGEAIDARMHLALKTP